MRCHRTILDGSYVLGSLAPAERREFAEHLLDCSVCSTAVQQVAGLPGLLAQVDPHEIEVESRPPPPPLPTSLLPSLVRETRRSRRRRTALVAAIAASAAAVVVAALMASGALPDRATPVPAVASITQTPLSLPMLALGPSPVTAEILVSAFAWGTRLELTCSYVDSRTAYGDGEYADGEYADGEHGTGETSSPAPRYALVVRTYDGRTDEVATWPGWPGETMRLSAVTAAAPSEIEAVEIRSDEGSVLLRARL